MQFTVNTSDCNSISNKKYELKFKIQSVAL